MKYLQHIAVCGVLSANMLMAGNAFAQKADPFKGAPENWFNLDKQKDGVNGIGTEKAYEEILKGKKSKKVVVAVIDSGIDVEHEDLKSVIWINKDEVAGNGKDDDNNGYVDDIHGWNFIGGKDGSHVSHDNLEVTRLYAQLSEKFKGVTESEVSKKDKEAYKLFKEVEKDFNKSFNEANSNYKQYSALKSEFIRAQKLMQAYFGVDSVPVDSLVTFNSPDERVNALAGLLGGLKSQGVDTLYLNEAVDYFESQVKYSYNTSFDSRTTVGDDYSNTSEKLYGNNDVIGPGAEHGTHVAGIIGADRTNNLGMMGVADNVEIMVIRTVPDGDERDKDVANAIRYAVDNGAKVINMSFGKSYSPEKEAVDAAVKYAMKKGVLLVHAAGNSSKNTDKERNFPKDKYESRGYAKNWIEVGALSWDKEEVKYPATFSNYAKKNVDLFAPGVDIYSTVPGSKYEAMNGTSMASPVVAGAAALLMSYYPKMTASDVKKVLMKTVKNHKNTEVYLPGYKSALREGKTPEKVKFSSLCVSGGIIDLYEAVKYAEKKYK